MEGTVMMTATELCIAIKTILYEQQVQAKAVAPMKRPTKMSEVYCADEEDKDQEDKYNNINIHTMIPHTGYPPLPLTVRRSDEDPRYPYPIPDRRSPTRMRNPKAYSRQTRHGTTYHA
jgi:hypothetical protein